MKLEAQLLTVELAGDLLEERAIGIKPCDFVFVLVGHQLEQITRNRVGETGFARCPRGFDLFDLVDPGAVARRIALILIGGEEFRAPLHRLVEGFGKSPRIARRRGRGRRDRFDLGAIERRATAPVKRGLVHGHGFAVELDRLLDRRGGKRQRAELIGVADQEHVGAERLAEQRGRDPRGVDEMHLVAAGIGQDGPLEPLGAAARNRRCG